MTERLSYGRQTIDDADIAAVVDALRSPQLTGGPRVGQFEVALAHWVGASHVTACASGTAALHLAYAALGIGEGDEVITTPITFSATAAAAYYVGARVRIADVDPRTGNLSPATVEPLITARTRAIVPVHLAGIPCDLDELIKLARQRRLRVIEDACHALGATYHGRLIGADAPGELGLVSDAVVTSFHPVKHITTGEGGAVIVRDPDTQRRVERLRSHGIERDPARFTDHPAELAPWLYEVQELGWNYRLPDVACALGLSQLTKLGRFVEARRRLAACYRAELAAAFGPDDPDAGVRPPPQFSDRSSAYHLFAVAIDFARYRTTRGRVMQALADAGIGTQVHYIPLLEHPLHARRCPDELGRPRPGADHYYARTLSLPLYPALTPDDVHRVVAELRRALLGSAPGESP